MLRVSDEPFDAGAELSAFEAAAKGAGAVVSFTGLVREDAASGDVRALTLRELSFLGAYCYTMADFRQAIALLRAGALGDLGWVERRPMSCGSRAFADIDAGTVAAAKIILTV